MIQDFATYKMQKPRLYTVPELSDPHVNRIRDDIKDNEKTLVQDWLCVKPGTVFNKQNLSITVLKPGRLNIHSGPDILDAMLMINGQIIIGTVECHLNSRSWSSHGHHLNPEYDSVILQVVRKKSQVDKLFPFPTIVLKPKMVNSNYCNLESGTLNNMFLNTIFQMANDRWQENVHSFHHANRGNLRSHCLEKSFAILGAGGNKEPFLKLARFIHSNGIGSLDEKTIKSCLETQMQISKGEWKHRSIRPAQWPENRLETAAALTQFIYSDKWTQFLNPHDLMSEFNLKIRPTAGEGCVVELLGNIFLPLGASQSIICGDTQNYQNWKTAWNTLVLPYSYGKYIRQFGHVLQSKQLRSFPVLQGLKVLESHFCVRRFCTVCPLKNTHARLEQNRSN